MAAYKKVDVPNVSTQAALQNYVVQLEERLDFAFSHLGKDNFNDSAWTTVTATPTASDVGALASTTTLSEMNGTLPVSLGGQGNITLPANRLLYGNDTDAVGSLAFPTTAGSFFRQGTSGAPYFSTPTEVLTAIGAQKNLSPALTVMSSTTAVASTTGVTLVSKTLSAGTYLLLGYAHFVPNTAGDRGISITTGTSFEDTSGCMVKSSTSWATALVFYKYVTVTTSAVFRLVAFQSSGSTINVDAANLLALKVA